LDSDKAVLHRIVIVIIDIKLLFLGDNRLFNMVYRSLFIQKNKKVLIVFEA